MMHQPVKATCQVCDESYETYYPTRRRTCSATCRQYGKKHPGLKSPKISRLCQMCKGTIPPALTRAAKYCSSRCTKAAGKRHAGITKRVDLLPRTPICQFCSAPMPDARGFSAKYCSNRCAIWAENPTYTYEQRTAAHRCVRCDVHFQPKRIDQAYCTPRCRQLTNAENRLKRMAALPRENFEDREIFERDQWRCRLCGEPIDPSLKKRSPKLGTLDHIIPVSDASCPGHVKFNVAASHLGCNQGRRGITEADHELLGQLKAAYGGDATYGRSQPSTGSTPSIKVLLG